MTESNHGLGVARRVEQITQGAFRVNPGSLFPALHRLEQKGWLTAEWGRSETNRKAKFYELTSAGRRHTEEEPATGSASRSRSSWPCAPHRRSGMFFFATLRVRCRHFLRGLFHRDQVEHELREELDG